MDTAVINTAQFGFRLAIYGLLLLTFCLGLPSFHYATALIIALLIRHRHDPGALLRPVGSIS
jgi:hypothetical protein